MNISKRVFLFVIFFFTLFGWAKISCALPAFPGAKGMGASSVGGRGGTVYAVTNLNNNGPGSFREAVEASGPRIVVFAISGHIRLSATLTVSHPYLTIAGQTSPGGVDVSGGMFMVSTHDVVVTHMRFRMGSDICDNISYPDVGNCETYGDTVRVMGTAYSGDNWAYNVIFDHCSMSWGNDETLDLGGYNGHTKDVTVSRCLIAQGLDDPAPEPLHGYGINIGSHYQNSNVTNVSLHHNYIAHFRLRLPQVSFNGFGDIRNNVIYNWEQRGAVLMDETDETYKMADYALTRVNALANHFKIGSLANGWACGNYGSGIAYYGEAYSDCIGLTTGWGRGQFYVSGNTGCANGRVWYGYSGANCTAANGYYTQRWLDEVSLDYIASSAHATNDIAVTTEAMDDSYVASILSDVGATKCQSGSCRDSVDTQFVADYNNNTGSTLADCHYPSTGCTYPTFSTPSVPSDSDSDGMADDWENSTFGSLSQTSSGDFDGDEYTNIEEYLFHLGDYSESFDITPPTAPDGLSVS